MWGFSECEECCSKGFCCHYPLFRYYHKETREGEGGEGGAYQWVCGGLEQVAEAGWEQVKILAVLVLRLIVAIL